jgi:hypothetical protein
MFEYQLEASLYLPGPMYALSPLRHCGLQRLSTILELSQRLLVRPSCSPVIYA